ncbi:asparagine synthetase B family protein [Leptolyngbya sp. CCNP1308]|uniref:asparagine synthetase B family protein n=1 Tax=Leptolyngbya sp. CCNP1308 TaxID=3110255 RepID=UPI002B21C817|nr:asparagine synthetase B family protein [Leptolyngbya sp. CCNP1308]MEA5449491.1 asparagine synthetase B family protein [Leptolyngbya sp. CCNP1308]
MGWDAIAAIAIQAQGCLGYWGYGDEDFLRPTLSDLVAQTQLSDWQLPSVQGDCRIALSASGMHADAWVTVTTDRLTLGRDAFGRMTLYWMQRDQGIWFASRLQWLLPLVRSQGKSPPVNLAALYGYSCFSYVPTPLTPVEDVMALPAGVEQTWAGQVLSPTCHNLVNWRESASQLDDEATAIAQLQALLKTAVERQVADLGDEPVGVLLSGGLDSSIVAALLVQAGVRVRAYTLDFGFDFGEGSLPEWPYAEQVAQSLGIPLVKVEAMPRRIRAALGATAKALDLPFGDGVTVPLYLLNQAASQEVGVIFNGEGGDQLFAGWTNKPLIAASLYQADHPEGIEPFAQQYLRTFHRLWGYEAQVFQPAVLGEIQALNCQDWLYPALEPTAAQGLLHRLRRASLMLKGAQNIHPRATNLALAQGLRVRSPFCDPDLAQWTFGLAGTLCLQGACEKYILKRAVEPWLPADIVWRPKRGMGVPLTAWCLNEWWRDLGQWLNPGVLAAEGRWQPDLALRTALGDLSGTIQGRRMGEVLWLLVMWQQWRSQVLGEPLENPLWPHPFWLPPQVWRYRKRWP